MFVRPPESDAEIRWIATRYEKIGAISIPDYVVTDEGIAEAEEFLRAQLADESWRVGLVFEKEEETEPIGMFICHLRNSPLDGCRECSIDTLHVEESRRRRGRGREILADAEAWGRARGATRVRTYVARSNDPMQGLCRGQGYRETFVELCRSFDGDDVPPSPRES